LTYGTFLLFSFLFVFGSTLSTSCWLRPRHQHPSCHHSLIINSHSSSSTLTSHVFFSYPARFLFLIMGTTLIFYLGTPAGVPVPYVSFCLFFFCFISNIFSPSPTLTPLTSVPSYVAHCHLQSLSLSVVHQHSSCFLLVFSLYLCSNFPNDPGILFTWELLRVFMCRSTCFFALLLSFSISNIFSPSLTLTPPTSVPPYVTHCHLRSLTIVHQHSSCFLLVSLF